MTVPDPTTNCEAAKTADSATVQLFDLFIYEVTVIAKLLRSAVTR